ncbi:TonB-dependent receptor domain-containing protein [Rhodohalobacter sp. SW132]|uniref:TonB-dependent receptor domain-containing protein n=1 Tax=Rhodohalobacter sp. SW132 TaxID=2293433 RepID=UPI0013153242|nr:TonB-dependent receptor [Rhodohalobacter sp. SW132]
MSMLLLFTLIVTGSAIAQTGSVSGIVTDRSSGDPLPGSNVFIEELGLGASADVDGQYSISDIPVGTYQISANFIGYTALERTIEIQSGVDTEMDFNLRADVLGLDQVVVTARGASSARREIGSSISSISTEELAEAPIQNMSQMLQGRVAGARVQLGGGKSGQGSTIVLRGAASISQSNEPIIYVDGVRIDNERSSGIGTTTAGVSWSGLDDINPEDIERMEVIRGASAATLYGSEASAGVIQIFTKRGIDGTPQFTYRNQVGMLNTPPSWWQVSEYSDWFYDEMVQTGTMTTHNLSVRGGVNNVRYYASGSFRNETGILPESGEDYLGFRLNLDFDPRDDLDISLNTSFSDRSVQHVPDANNTRGYTINGLVGGPQGQFGTPTRDHTAIQTFQDGNRFNTSLQMNHNPAGNFSHRVTLGYESRNEDQTQFFPFGAINNLINGFKSNYRRNVTNFNVDYVATLRFQPTEWLRTTTSGGFQYFDRDVGSNSAIGNDFPMVGLSTVSATVDQSAAESRFKERSAGFFVEQQFGFNERLYVTLGARADGHSAFGDDVDYVLYPKIDASYIISESSFWNENWGTLRLRGAYGTAGQQPGAFSAVRTWSPVSAVGAQPAVTPDNLGNPDLKAEVSHEYEIGFDASVLNDRLNIDFNYFYQRTEDALYQFRYPPSQGFISTQLENVGEIKNQGIELSLNGVIIDRGDFRWNGLVNYSTNENEVISLGDGAPVQVQWRQFIQEGYSVGSFFGDRYITVDGQTDLASNLLDTSEEGWDYIGPALPTRTAQIGSTFDIRNFNVKVLFDHQSGGYLQSSTLRWLWDPRRDISDGQGVATPGPVAIACREPANEVINMNCQRNSDLTQGDFVFPSDFWKLRELSVTYRVPSDLVSRAGLRNAALTFSGRNLWRSQEYEGLEAEANYRGDLSDSAIRKQIFFDTPIPRQFIVGINIGF